MRRLSTLGLCLALVPFAAATTSRGATAERECIAHWRFQNGVKGTVAGPAHLIVDSSGNDQHGLVVGNPRFERVDLPRSNLALVFSSDEDRIFVPDDEVFYLTSSMTIEACIRVDRYPEGAAKLGYIVFRGDNRPGFDPWFLGIRESGQLVFQVANDLDQVAAVTTPGPVPLGVVMHVAGTLDHETGEQSLFVDGIRVATEKTAIRAGGALGGSCPGIGIGNLQSGGTGGFRGLIDEVRISAAALGPDGLPSGYQGKWK